MRLRNSLSVLGVVATALTGAVLASGPAAASSGGGCGTPVDGMMACVSASGNEVRYDMYVTSVPAGCTQMSITIIDDRTSNQDTLNVGCHTGYDGMFSVLGINGDGYQSYGTLWKGSADIPTSTSPELHFSN